MDRWATFDCYGTLVDWESGIGAALERSFGRKHGERLLARYHEIEPRIQADDPTASYREVMARAMERIAAEEGVELAEDERELLARSLPGWPVFGEVPAALREARNAGWKLAILSNTDRDLIDASVQAIGVPFELAIVASEIGSYKPAHGHWDAFFEQTGAERDGHVHVAASLFHDIAPARELGLRRIWVNRRHEPSRHEPERELTDLGGLAGALEVLVQPVEVGGPS